MGSPSISSWVEQGDAEQDRSHAYDSSEIYAGPDPRFGLFGIAFATALSDFSACADAGDGRNGCSALRASVIPAAYS